MLNWLAASLTIKNTNEILTIHVCAIRTGGSDESPVSFSLSLHNLVCAILSVAQAPVWTGRQWWKYIPPRPSKSGDVATWILVYAPSDGVLRNNDIIGVAIESPARIIKLMLRVTSVRTHPGWTALQVTPDPFAVILEWCRAKFLIIKSTAMWIE